MARRLRTTEPKTVTLLVSLVLLLGFHPFLADGTTGRVVLGVLLIVILTTSSWALYGDRRHRIRNLTLGSLAVLGTVMHVVSTQVDAPQWLSLVFPLTILVFFINVAGSLLAYVMRGGGSPRSRLAAALSVYLIFGMAWSMAYLALYNHDPGSFAFGVAKPTEQQPASMFIYFSFVTLTTLGYGDVQPISAQARSLAMLEAVLGVLYIAVMVASLVNPASTGDADGEA